MVGAGYVGLVSGACFSEFGIDVVCLDSDPSKIDRLRGGDIPIYEPGLAALVESNVNAGRLSFTTDAGEAVCGSDAVFIAVGTPGRHGDGRADLGHVRRAAEDVARCLGGGYTVVVMKSTVPVGTGREIGGLIARHCAPGTFDVASNPEFLREGSAIGDFMRPDRVVIGVESERAAEVLRAVYRPLYLLETPIVFTALETAETIKYAANAFLATKITFINEIADLCEAVGADVQDVARGIGLDGRIGSKFLHAGPGYGGSCLPKDTRALVSIAREAGARMRVVEAVIEANEGRASRMVGKVEAACGGTVSGKRVAVLGLTFKPNTDDIRESPGLAILAALTERGASLRAFDPRGMDAAKELFPGVAWCEDAYAAMEDADCLVIVTEWNEFRALDIDRVRRAMRIPALVDLRNIYEIAEMEGAAFDYRSVGRRAVEGPP